MGVSDKEILQDTLKQMERIKGLDAKIKKFVRKYNKVFNNEPEDAVRILADISEITKKQLTIAEKIGMNIKK